MKTITEAEAQQLAILFRSWIAVDSNEYVYMFKNKPHIDTSVWNSYLNNPYTALPIRISSDRPWTEQIWGPE